MFFTVFFPSLLTGQGVQVFDQPGHWSFNVPVYQELMVEVWGAGGSGGGFTEGSGSFAGNNGQNSFVNTVPANLVAGAGYGAPASDTGSGGGGLVFGIDFLLAEDGSAILTEDEKYFYIGTSEDGEAGGLLNQGWGGAAGGVPYGGGGPRLPPSVNGTNGLPGNSYGGGGSGARTASGSVRPGGGGGGYARKVYYAGEPNAPVSGETLTLFVGFPGGPGNGTLKGGSGAPGAVRFTWL